MKLKELNIWLKDLSNLTMDLNISLYNAQYLIKEKGTPIEQKIKEKDFFKYHIHQLMFIMTIQLCKIFDDSSNQKRNVHKLFHKLRNEGYDNELREKLIKNSDLKDVIKNKKEIIEVVDILQNKIILKREFIKYLVCLRNTAYAHTDNADNSAIGKWTDLKELIALSSEIYNKIHGGIYGKHTMFDLAKYRWSPKEIIKPLAELSTTEVLKKLLSP